MKDSPDQADPRGNQEPDAGLSLVSMPDQRAEIHPVPGLVTGNAKGRLGNRWSPLALCLRDAEFERSPIRNARLEYLETASFDLLEKGKIMAQNTETNTETTLADIRTKGAEAVGALRDAGAEVARQTSETVSQLVEEGQHRAVELRDQAKVRGSVLMDDLNAAYDASVDFARRNPALVIAGAAVAGYALSRALRNQADTDSRSADNDDDRDGTKQTSDGRHSGSSAKSAGGHKRKSAAKATAGR
jgi:hypothetical protein